MEKLLCDMLENQTAKVVKVLEQNDQVLCRLQEYGLVDGEIVRVIKIAPQSKVYLISIRGFALCLDKETCKKVVVSE